jgi:hypothetical protein
MKGCVRMTSQDFIKTLASAKVLAGKIKPANPDIVQKYMTDNGINADIALVTMFMLGAGIDVPHVVVLEMMEITKVDDYNPLFDMYKNR